MACQGDALRLLAWRNAGQWWRTLLRSSSSAAAQELFTPAQQQQGLSGSSTGSAICSSSNAATHLLLPGAATRYHNLALSGGPPSADEHQPGGVSCQAERHADTKLQHHSSSHPQLASQWPWQAPATYAHARARTLLPASLLRHASTSATSAPSTPPAAAEQQLPPPAPPIPAWLAALPASWLPYTQLMRLDKPIGTWLLLWPCLWSITMAGEPGALPDLWTMSLFSVGAVLLRGAGCTINDLWDRDLDKRVERTRTRPLASGALQPWQAIALLGGQLSLGLCVLLQLNWYSQLLGASSLLLVATYPLMKRVTYWPQAYLGLTINWGALLGWAAVRGSSDWAVVLPLYGAGVCWSLIYDTIYAHQDKRDDVTAGVRSTALLFGARTKPVLSAFTALQLALLTASGAAAGMGPGYYVGVAAMGAHLAQQIYTVDLDNGPQCSATFVSNKWAGALLLAGCVAGRTFA